MAKQTKRSRHGRAAAALTVATFAAASLLAGAASAPAGAATDGGRSPVRMGGVPTIPPGAHAKGAVPDQTSVHLVVTLQPRDPAALRNMVEAVSTPGNKLYRQFLSTGEFGAEFGASDAEIAKVRAGLADLGLQPGPTAPNRLSIPVDTTAAKASAALQTPLQAYRTANGRDAYANTSAPVLPAKLADSVQGILGLDTLPVAHPGGAKAAVDQAHPNAAERGSTATSGLTPAGVPVACSAAATAATGYGGATPADYLSAYSATSLVSAGHAGNGMNVAVLSLQGLNTPEINVFRQCFGATGGVTDIKVDGGASAADGYDEASLDVETILGLAPKANISFFESPNSAAAWYDNMAAIVGTNTAKSVSVSWGLCEAAGYQTAGPDGSNNLLDSELNVLAQAALQGQTFFASTGDDGSAACNSLGSNLTQLAVSDPASQPYVTAVGGTSLNTTTAPPDEAVWNNSYGASGGGASNYWWQPSFQSGVTDGYDSSGNWCGNAGGYRRTTPDVAASADPGNHGLVVYIGGQWRPYGGTSLAAPVWASLTADMNSSCPATHGFGVLNFTLYTLPQSDFNDVTAGNNDFVGTNGGQYPAKSGYDLATGLGTPVVSNLTSDLCGVSPRFTANESFILAAYLDFLGGFPTTSDYDYWDSVFATGTSHRTMISTLANSNAWITNIVTGFYENTLGRGPDSGGLNYWIYKIRSGTSVAKVAASFYSSAEYFNGYGHGSLTTWVRDLYPKLLGRTPDSSGVNYWVSQAKKGPTAASGRTKVAYSFYQSFESRMKRVKDLYLALLHRNPDSGGQTYWAGVVKSSGDIALAQNLANSSEYATLAKVRFP